MKRVGLYCREFAAAGTGPAAYARETVEALAAYPDEGLAYTLIVPESADAPELPASFEVARVPDAHRLMQDHLHAPRLLNRLALDLVWLPKNVLPYGLEPPAVVSLLDLAYFFPKYRAYGKFDTVYMKRMMRRSARKAARLVAISEHTKRDILEVLPVSGEKVTVVYPAISPRMRLIHEQAVLERVQKTYGLPPQFIFYAGDLSPRKNLLRLVEAFRRIQGEVPHHLVITGTRVSDAEEAFRRVVATPERVKVLGRVPAEDLPALYSLADCYAHVSLYEGFGLTIAEAQACGTPVLNSNVTCMPEVGGDGALYVDPFDEDAIAGGLLRLLRDEGLRKELAAKGIENASRFQGAEAARRLQDVFLAV